ncbi:MAG: carbonic anhydrase [Candidatus Eremiobacterota bacterium]
MSKRDTSYHRLLQGNRQFVEQRLREDPKFFTRLAKGQSPFVLWIGCSDSRLPPNDITSTTPGEVFVHRNIANVVVHTDFNLLSVLEYAVNHLHVTHVIVCGHYGCGGVHAALSQKTFGLLDNWLRNIKDVYRIHRDELEAIPDPVARERRLVELNVVESVYNVCKTSILQGAWKRRQLPHVHGWVYDISNGLIQDLDANFSCLDELERIYRFDPHG